MKARALYSQEEYDNDLQLAEAAKKQIDEVRAYYSDVIAITDVITLPEVAEIVMNTRHGPITLKEMCTRNELRAVLRALGDSPGADPEQVAYIAIKDYRENIAHVGEQQTVPVVELELSVRSRMCLHKMGINTLGDLARTTEKALRDSRNFGDVSINEIKEVLAAHGFSLGPPPAVVGMPIADLNLAPRANKALHKLGVKTVGDLIIRTAEELLTPKTFGIASLNEVREKLAEVGLKLRGD